eukprot:251029_1
MLSKLCFICPNVHASLHKSNEQKVHQIIQLTTNHEEKEVTDDNKENLTSMRLSTYAPIFAFQHYTLIRQFSEILFIKCLIRCLFHPLLLIYQTVIFLFPSVARYQDEDFTEISTILYYDFLHVFVGRYYVDKKTGFDSRWFVIQTTKQKIARVFLTILILLINVYAWYTHYLYIYHEDHVGPVLSVTETSLPVAIIFCILLIYSIYVASSRISFPNIPSTDKLKQFYLYQDNEYQTNAISAYQFYQNHFASDRDIIFTRRNVSVCVIISILIASVPFVTRQMFPFYESNTDLYSSGLLMVAICSFVVNTCLICTVFLSLVPKVIKAVTLNFKQMQILTYLLKTQSYILLNNTCANKLFSCGRKKEWKTLPYLSLCLKNNNISWLELRSLIYWKNKVLMAQSESVILALIYFSVMLGLYLFWRLLTDSSTVKLGSASFVATLLMFTFLLFIVLMMLMDSFAIQKLQKYQERFIAHQRARIEMQMISKMNNDMNDNDSQNTFALQACKENFDILLKAVKDQNILPKVYGITLDIALLRSIIAIAISGVYTAFQYIYKTS